jgi:AraC-like DNA-binding protein
MNAVTTPTRDSMEWTERMNPMLEELSDILSDCLRLNCPNDEAVAHILRAIQCLVLETTEINRLPPRNDLALQPWQEAIAIRMLASGSHDADSIQEVAIKCGLSPERFSRAFKSQFGFPPQHWRLRSRIEQAKSMMVATSTSLTNIAIECGFAEQSHFNHSFQKLVGLPPGDWRRQHANASLVNWWGDNSPEREHSGDSKPHRI